MVAGVQVGRDCFVGDEAGGKEVSEGGLEEPRWHGVEVVCDVVELAREHFGLEM